jgi:hypothetical protein
MTGLEPATSGVTGRKSLAERPPVPISDKDLTPFLAVITYSRFYQRFQSIAANSLKVA